MESMAVKEKEKVYEAGVHYVPTLEPSDAEKKLAEIKDVVSSQGTVLGEEAVQKQDLAYTIRHKVRRQTGTYDRYNESYFGSVKFLTSQEVVRNLQERLHGDEQVLRFLIVETVKDSTRIGPVLPDEEEKEEEKKEGKGKGANDTKEAKSTQGDEA